MHEEALVRDLRRRLIELGRSERAERFTRVVFWVGALSHVREPMLRDRWAEISEGTPAAGALIEVETSEDLYDPRAAGVVLESVGLPSGPSGPTGADRADRPGGPDDGPSHRAKEEPCA